VLRDVTKLYPVITPYLCEKLDQHNKASLESNKVVEKNSDIPQNFNPSNSDLLSQNSELKTQLEDISGKYQKLKSGLQAFNLTNMSTLQASPISLKVLAQFKTNIETLVTGIKNQFQVEINALTKELNFTQKKLQEGSASSNL